MKTIFQLEKIRTLLRTFQMLTRDFPVGMIVLSLSPWPLGPRCHLAHWQQSSKSECLVHKNDILKWSYLFLKESISRIISVYSDNELVHGQNSQALKFSICPYFSSLLTYSFLPFAFTVSLDMEDALLMHLWFFNPKAKAKLTLEGWLGYSKFRISVWWCSSLQLVSNMMGNQTLKVTIQ